MKTQLVISSHSYLTFRIIKVKYGNSIKSDVILPRESYLWNLLKLSILAWTDNRKQVIEKYLYEKIIFKKINYEAYLTLFNKINNINN